MQFNFSLAPAPIPSLDGGYVPYRNQNKTYFFDLHDQTCVEKIARDTPSISVTFAPDISKENVTDYVTIVAGYVAISKIKQYADFLKNQCNLADHNVSCNHFDENEVAKLREMHAFFSRNLAKIGPGFYLDDPFFPDINDLQGLRRVADAMWNAYLPNKLAVKDKMLL